MVNSPVQNFTPDGLIVLAATGNFINNVGRGAVVDPWLIYSASPTGDVFNGLDSGNTAVWNTTFGEPVTATGNRYIFAFQPTITVTSTNDAKTYGQDVTSRVATDYVISGLQAGDRRRLPRRQRDRDLQRRAERDLARIARHGAGRRQPV